jgi:hypothetical protein
MKKAVSLGKHKGPHHIAAMRALALVFLKHVDHLSMNDNASATSY